MNCTLDRCNEPRHVASTGLQHATMCDAHHAMLGVLAGALGRRSGNSMGATGLFQRMEASTDGLTILEDEFRRRWGSPDGARELIEQVEAARMRAGHPPKP